MNFYVKHYILWRWNANDAGTFVFAAIVNVEVDTSIKSGLSPGTVDIVVGKFIGHVSKKGILLPIPTTFYEQLLCQFFCATNPNHKPNLKSYKSFREQFSLKNCLCYVGKVDNCSRFHQHITISSFIDNFLSPKRLQSQIVST